MFLERYFIFIIPLQCILISFIINIISRNSGIAKISFALLVIALSITGFSFDTSKHMNYKDAVSWIKTYRGNNETIIIQTNVLDFLFAYYYSPGCFKNYRNIDACLQSDHEYCVNDSANLSQINYVKSGHIFMIQTFTDYADPKNTLGKALKNEYNCIRTSEFEGAKVTEWVKSSQYSLKP